MVVPWVTKGAELLGGIYRLDTFHPKGALNQTLDDGLATEVDQGCTAGEVDSVDRLLTQSLKIATAEEANEVARLRRSL